LLGEVSLRIFVLLILCGALLLPREGIASPIRFQPSKKEGYFQGWNYYFRTDSKDTLILVTFLVSNLGPGSLNHGTAVYIHSPVTGILYKTNEYSSRELYATPGKFGQKSRDSYMEKRGTIYHIHIQTEEMDLELEYFPKADSPILLSDGDYRLEEYDGILRADIGFPISPARARFNHYGKDYFFSGTGGMEHLKTDTEVYKFSSRWEILRGYSLTGEGIFFGGYKGLRESKNATENLDSGGFFRAVHVSRQGKIEWHDEVSHIKTIQKEKNDFSGYVLPLVQEVYFRRNKDCTMRITDSRLLAEVNVLSNISAVLKFLIRLFFAKPYHIHFTAEVLYQCKGKAPVQFTGIHSYYLINPSE